MEDFKQHLTKLNQEIAHYKSQLSDAVSPPFIEQKELLPPYSLLQILPSSKQVMQKFLAAFEHDVTMFRNEKIPTETSTNLHEENSSEEPEEKISPYEDVYISNFNNEFSFYSIDDYQDIKESHRSAYKNLTTEEKQLYNVLAKECEYLAENLGPLGYTVGSLNKIKKSMETVLHGRFNDAAKILLNAKRDEPKNRVVSFCLSQIYYFMACHGHKEHLPEARNEAKRSCVFGEGFDDNRLLIYRYTYMCSEYPLKKDRALELIREHHLLSPDSLMRDSGLAAKGGLHLKSWILLSQTPADEWNEFELKSLSEIATRCIGGVIFYIHFFQEKVQKLIGDDFQTYPELHKVEQLIKKAHIHHTDLLNVITSNFDEQGKPLNSLQPYYPWLMKQRYLESVLSISPYPSFDSIYLFNSLDGRRYDLTSEPTPALRNKLDVECNYWRIWGLSISPFEKLHKAELLPVREIVLATPIMVEAQALIQKLQLWETDCIGSDDWSSIESIMPTYTYKSFIEVATGQTDNVIPPPKETYYLPFYRKWSTSSPRGKMFSSIIAQHAGDGGFITVDEILQAFQGVERILPDKVFGLKARIAQALKKISQKDSVPKSIRKQAQNRIIQKHFNEFWWIYLILLPLMALIFMVMASAESLADFLITAGIVVVMLTVCIALFALIWKSNASKD